MKKAQDRSRTLILRFFFLRKILGLPGTAREFHNYVHTMEKMAREVVQELLNKGYSKADIGRACGFLDAPGYPVRNYMSIQANNFNVDIGAVREPGGTKGRFHKEQRLIAAKKAFESLTQSRMSRAQAIGALAGKFTLQEIGEVAGITRERVRQLANRMGNLERTIVRKRA